MTVAQAATITLAYDAGKTAAENGTALQAAINAASSGDELKVQAGTYIGNFTMKEGVQVSGGWNSTFDAQTDYATVLDANANGRVVEQPSNFTTLTIWSNLTIQNGKLTTASSVPANNLGSGVALGKKGQVKHCLIQNNTFNYNANCMGGGVGNDAVDAATDICAEDCWIRNNSGTHGGGARVRGTLLNCVIENNNTNNSVKKGPAGGVHLQGGRMVNCIVRGNTSGGDTGGARALNTSLIENCTIENNISLGKTGGVSLEGTSTLSNSIIKNNTSTTECGGVRSAAKSNIYNNLIYGNTAGTKQGGLLIESALPNVIGNTIVCNNQLTGTGSQAGVFITNTLEANGTFFVNNVVWGNMSNGTVESQGVYYISRYDKSTGQRSYNAIIGQKGDDSAETSIQLSADDPGFTDAAHGDFSLLPTSVLLDRGNSAKATVSKDLAGNDRIVNSSVDIGAYEYPVVASDVYVLEGEDLQSKINNTATGYTVYVQAGTYYGNFTMKDGVNVSGGWDATFENQTDYATVLDAQENGRVVNQPSAFSTLTIWSNLTIQNGSLSSKQTDEGGAGVWLNKKGQVKHCKIQNNTYTYASGNCMGGGVGNNAVDAATDVLIDECIICNNRATHGGGVRIRGTIQNSEIYGNTATNNSGGAFILGGGYAVNTIIHDNTGKGIGGIKLQGAGEIRECQIYDNNSTTDATGGVNLHERATMSNCIVRGNRSGGDSGGVRLTTDNNGNGCTLANCLIVDNEASGKIGGLAMEASGIPSTYHKVYNNTIVGNSQTSSTNPDWCGVRQNVGGPLQFCNNVVWGNKANGSVQASQVYVVSSYSAQVNNFVNNALVWNGKLSDDSDFNVPSTMFLTEDPFKDAANGDYTPTAGSGLIDSGHGGYFHGTTDLAGNTRKQGTIDRGCYEQAAYSREVTEGRFGTICLPYNVPADAIVGAKVYKVISFASDAKAGLLLEQVNTMIAGKPYFFSSEADKVVFAYLATGDAATAGSENGLYGTLAEEAISGDDYYVLQNNLLCPTTAGEISLAANRAYLKFSKVPDYEEAAPSPIRRVITIQQTENTATGTDQMVIDKSLNGKFIHDGQLLIVHDGKTYNVLGL